MFIKSVKVTGGKMTATFTKDYINVQGEEAATWKLERVPASVQRALDNASATCRDIVGFNDRHSNSARCYGAAFSINDKGETKVVAMVTSQPEGLPAPITVNIPALILIDPEETEPKNGSVYASPEFSKMMFAIQDTAESAIRTGKDQGELDFIDPEPEPESSDAGESEGNESDGNPDEGDAD